MVAVLTLGAMVGALANGPIADRLSRRWSNLLANGIFLIGSIIQAAAKNIAMIFVGRFIAGLAIGGLSMVIPLCISELAPANLRGSLVSLQRSFSFEFPCGTVDIEINKLSMGFLNW